LLVGLESERDYSGGYGRCSGRGRVALGALVSEVCGGDGMLAAVDVA